VTKHIHRHMHVFLRHQVSYNVWLHLTLLPRALVINISKATNHAV